jgi:phage I-like protein
MAERKEEPQWMKTLKAWCHWVTLNPINEDQKDMAEAVNNLFSLLGTREARLAELEKELESTKHEMWDQHTTMEMRLMKERDTAVAQLSASRAAVAEKENNEKG